MPLNAQAPSQQVASKSGRLFAVADKIIVLAIIIDQLVLALFCLLVGWAGYPPWSNHSSTAYKAYMLLGIGSAFALFLKSLGSRVAAALWHAIFIGLFLSGYWKVILRGSPSGLIHWAWADILAAIYLAITSAILLFNSKFLPTERLTLNNVLQLIDAIIVCGVALGQLGFATFVLIVQLTFAYMGGPDVVATPFMILGIISAIFLFSGWTKPRISALLWQALLVCYILLKGNPESPADMSWKARVLWFVPTLLYLSVTTLIQLRKDKLRLAP